MGLVIDWKKMHTEATFCLRTAIFNLTSPHTRWYHSTWCYWRLSHNEWLCYILAWTCGMKFSGVLWWFSDWYSFVACRFLSQILILGPKAFSSLTTAAYITQRRFVALSKMKLMCGLVYQLPNLTFCSRMQIDLPSTLLAWSESHWTSFFCSQSISLMTPARFVDLCNWSCMSQYHPPKVLGVFSRHWAM